MPVPARRGLDDARWRRELARFDRARDETLRNVDDPTDIGGVVVLWMRATDSRVETRSLGIQPGIADDLRSLLSSLAAEIAWPGVPDADPAAERVVAVWARVWQVRDAMDLRVTLHWGSDGRVYGDTALRARDGVDMPLLDINELLHQLDRMAATPTSSESPHGLLLAGNRAMQANDALAARDCYLRALADLPGHPEVHRNLALALARLGEWEAAAAAMREAFALAPDDAALRAEYLALETDAGIEAVREQRLDAAAEHFLRILDRWPDEPTALANLGNIRLREDRRPEARAIYRRFLRLHPKHPAADTISLALAELGEA